MKPYFEQDGLIPRVEGTMLKIDFGEASDNLLHDLQLCGNDEARDRIGKYLDSAFKQGVEAAANAQCQLCEGDFRPAELESDGAWRHGAIECSASAIRALVEEGEKKT